MISFNINFEVNTEQSNRVVTKKISQVLEGIGAEIEKHAKLIAPVDTELLRAGIHYSLIEPLELVITSSVKYDLYFEYGTDLHFVPFFNRDGQITSLGEWAMRNLGKSEKELAQMGGFNIKTPELRMYRGGIENALQNLQIITEKVWRSN